MERDERVTMERDENGESEKKIQTENETVGWKTEVEWRRMEEDSWRENQTKEQNPNGRALDK